MKKIFSKDNFSFGKIVTVAVLLVVTSAVVSASMWVFVNLEQSSVSKTTDAHITSLEEQLIQLKTAVKTQETLSKNNVAIGSTATTKQ